jgi:hypothetical protein
VSIRSNLNRKDHLREQAQALTLVAEPARPVFEEPLRFVTAHPNKPTLVDLRALATGQDDIRTKGTLWKGPYSGRPELIAEMAPAIQDHLLPLAEKSVALFMNALRTWWRLFDALEATLAPGTVLKSTAQLTEVHRQRALDQGMDRLTYGNFLLLANRTRAGLGLKQLYWQRPEQATRTRHLPPQWQTDLVRHELKHRWFAIASRLDAANASFPSGDDIRCAFQLCLATTGWNPAVFVSLNVDDPFIEEHPKDPTRYILRGFKDRGGSEQVSEGLFKSQGGAGFILRFLVEQTQPLRDQLKKELKKGREALESDSTSNTEDRIRLEERVRALERGIRSLWLYVSPIRNGVHWLGDDDVNRRGYLASVITDINKRQPADKQLARLTPGDLRDAYAARIYHASGGSILAVMKALNHKRIGTTAVYLDNTLLKEEHAKMFATYSEALWHEVKVHRRIDPSIIAKWSRDGSVTKEQRHRLDKYRKLLRSRIGVGCKDPLNPPKRLAPNFTADGVKHCSVQRCLLCAEHAVVFPDSLPGICKRLAELYYLKANMSVPAYLQSTFGTEIENAELILHGFDQNEVRHHLHDWQERIATGIHRVAEFDGKEG